MRKVGGSMEFRWGKRTGEVWRSRVGGDGIRESYPLLILLGKER